MMNAVNPISSDERLWEAVLAGDAGVTRRHQPVPFAADIFAAARHLATRVPGRAARAALSPRPQNGQAGHRRDLRRRLRIEQPRVRTAADRTWDDARAISARCE